MGREEPRAGARVRAAGVRWTTWVLLAAVVAYLVLAALDPSQTLVGAGLGLLLMAGALVLQVVVHEAGHALAGLATGMAVPTVELGAGRPLVAVRLGRTTVRISGFHGGATHYHPRSTTYLRTRMAVVTLAGPLSNVASSVVAWSLVQGPFDEAGPFVWAFVSGGLVLGVGNLVPFTVTTPAGKQQSDGLALLTMRSVDDLAGARLVAAGRLDSVQRDYVAGVSVAPAGAMDGLDRRDPVMLGMEGTRRIFSGEHTEAVALLREAAALPHDDDLRALTLNNLAWALVLSRPEGWLQEAERASAEAEWLRPGMDAMLSTRGCILVHCGDLEDARPLLLKAITADGAAPHERVLLHAHLLQAELGLGNLYGARAALLAMLDLGAAPEALAEARARLRPAEVDNALTRLVGADGRIRWEEIGAGRELARHRDEMRSALEAFVAEAVDDPRREAVRLALG